MQEKEQKSKRRVDAWNGDHDGLYVDFQYNFVKSFLTTKPITQ